MTARQPKVILFDIGGVCVKSPFQSILDCELQLGIPPGWINYSISKTAPNGWWHKIERGDIPMDNAFFEGFRQDLHDAARWEAFYKREQSRNPSFPRETPPLPSINAQDLFHEMMSAGDTPDPWIYPALKNLRDDGRFIIAALSNTVIFPPGHRFHKEDFFNDPLRKLFDVFISSAHVGLRKPDPKMYQFAVGEVDRFARDHADDPRARTLGWAEGVSAQDIVFLDDIGENLREAKKQGFGTIKVSLGKAYEAVAELEKVTGLKLAGDHPTPSTANSSPIHVPKAKI
jgi:FMN phosphatase YigB (HAD superfamily)